MKPEVEILKKLREKLLTVPKKQWVYSAAEQCGAISYAIECIEKMEERK